MNLPLKLWTGASVDSDWTGFLDRDGHVEGTLEVPGTFRLDGALKGRIVSRHALVLGETAQVDGEIEGERVEIYGRFQGTLRASERIEIHSSARVTADLYGPCLILNPGAWFDGRFHLQEKCAQAEVLVVPVRPAPADHREAS